MEEIHRFQDVILLSDKTVARIEVSRVWFTDGSVADLEQLAVSNRGSGEIKFELLPDIEILDNVSTEVFRLSLGQIIAIEGDDLFFEIDRVDSNETLLEVTGNNNFLATTEVYEINSGLLVRTAKKQTNISIGDVYINGRRVKGDPIEGKLRIATPVTPKLVISSNGRGNGRIQIPIESLLTKINGSLKVNCKHVENAEIDINGSGSVQIQELSNSGVININGSGEVRIESGKFEELKATVNGSGSISAEVIVQRAELISTGSGAISIKQVIDEAYEVHRGGSVRVQKRGQ